MIKSLICIAAFVSLIAANSLAQKSVKPNYNGETVYAGIEVGAKGVKLSVLGIGKNAKKTGNFSVFADKYPKGNYTLQIYHNGVKIVNTVKTLS
jgi:hypothetical protein